jgi:hypothetical protein
MYLSRPYLSGRTVPTSRLLRYRIRATASTISCVRFEYSLLGKLLIVDDGFEFPRWQQIDCTGLAARLDISGSLDTCPKSRQHASKRRAGADALPPT